MILTDKVFEMEWNKVYVSDALGAKIGRKIGTMTRHE